MNINDIETFLKTATDNEKIGVLASVLFELHIEAIAETLKNELPKNSYSRNHVIETLSK